MVKLVKPGRVVMVLAGRYAGTKAVVVSVSESGTTDRPFGHALLAGIARPPQKVHKRMSKAKIEKRVKVKSYVKTVNFNHIMPTRYVVSPDFDLKSAIGETPFESPDAKKTAKSGLSSLFLQKFLDPVNPKTGKASKDLLFLRNKLHF